MCMNQRRNKGQITVYACGIAAVSLILVLAVLRIIRINEAKSRCYQTVMGAVRSLKGDYQPDMFKRYHILAVDDTYYGRGEGYMEERIMDYLRSNMDSGQSLYRMDIVECSLVDQRYLMDNNCADFKLQIEDYMKEKLPVDLAGMIFGEFGRDDKSDNEYAKEAGVLAEIWKQRQTASNEEEKGVDLSRQVSYQEIYDLGMIDIIADQETDSDAITIEDLANYNATHHVLEDPRKSLEAVHSLGILYFVIPDRVAEISTDSIDLEQVPSAGYRNTDWTWTMPSFSGVTGLQGLAECFQEDQGFHQFRQDQISSSELYGIAYALDSFQGVQNTFYQRDSEYHAFDYELEYILIGKSSDSENVKAVANRLFVLRLVPNLAYAYTDKEMKMQAETAATVICVPTDTEFLIKPLTYVFLACWGCAESVMDVKALFQGERIPVIKSDKTWQLSIGNIANLAEQEVSSIISDQEEDGSEKAVSGLNYSEYMAILLAAMPDSDMKYYRMLDVMELNIKERTPEFEMEHCMDEFKLQTQLREQEISWYIEGYGSYIR